ncbi:MAG: MOSC domain-containing protein [Gemmatimonadaceae bacterium]|nr:MOSC domain-containing protein [Gemmatimonadaceae bacterium]
MPTEIGAVSALVRYPVKSMRGESLEDVALGWHGVAGDRRLALRRLDDRGGFPWLTASRLPELLRYAPVRDARDDGEALPTHIITPDGDRFALFDPALCDVVGRRAGIAVEMTHLDRGIFDDAPMSIISAATAQALCEAAGLPADPRRFRPNVVLDLAGATAFAEDRFVGQVLTFGDAHDAPAVFVTHRDVRCAMVNHDPDTAEAAPQLLKGLVQSHGTCAGIYGTVVRPGRVRVGAAVYASPAT